MEEVIILGGGVAGLSAAIYCGRAHLSPFLISGPMPGGWISSTSLVENFPGFPEGISGFELTERMRKQAKKFGTRISDSTASKIEKTENAFKITCDDGTIIESRAVIFATGSSSRRLGLESENTYLGKGLSTCATCDAYFFKDKDVAVIGGGDSACHESTFIAKFAKTVTIIHRKDNFRASKAMQKQVADEGKISAILNSSVEEILGDGTRLTGLKLKNLKTDEITEHKFDGVFLAIGHVPNTKLLEGLAEVNKAGHLKLNKRFMTKVPGLFGAGDVADHVYKQAITASASGCMAALEVQRFLKNK
jgi:thioredoxin reductase (NADPH)